MVKFPGGTPGRWEKIAHELGRSVTDVTTKAKQLKDSVTSSPGMVRLSELKSTVQNSRPVKTATALPDDIITQREAAQGAQEEAEQEEDPAEQETEVEEAQPRKRKPARLLDKAPRAESEEKVRGKRQRDFDLSEQNESSDEESQKKTETGQLRSRGLRISRSCWSWHCSSTPRGAQSAGTESPSASRPRVRKTVSLGTSCWLNWSKRKNKLKAEYSGR